MTISRTLGLALAAGLLLTGVAAAQVSVEQDATSNKLLINQRDQAGNAPQKDKVFTTGNDKNSVTHVQQRGETDAVEATQSGETNTIRANQRATDNAVSATQTGETNTAKIRQTNPN